MTPAHALARPGARRALCAALLAIGLGVPALAAEGPGKSRQARPEPRQALPVGGYFRPEQRQAASQYFAERQAKGRCPPGLAKKNNGCLPPGQAKKWKLGQVLPGDVRIYPLPAELSVRIGAPPPGYRYVRVLNDILLIAIGTRMVIDAIEDLMRP